MFVAQAPSIAELIEDLGSDAVTTAITSPEPPDDRYLHWDKLRRLPPPEGITSEQWWLKLKLSRAGATRRIPLADTTGAPFGYSLPDPTLRLLHRVDQRCAGEIAMDKVVTSQQQAEKRFLVNSLMEEAIRSSQLEGATTSRHAAKEMLRSGRPPVDRSERMIANNYRALQYMREEMGERLTPEGVLELHRIVTAGTLDDPTAAGRFQRPDERRVAVFDRDEGDPIHTPPPAEQLPERMRLLCDFANEGDESRPFVHPVVRAILVHFWLAYDHPFEDGNGRTARILFFWLMRIRGYWLAEYLPISRLIRQAPARYARAFVESETDGGDLTYFLIHQLETIDRAIDELHAYLRRKTSEIREIDTLLHGISYLNGRQLALLANAVRHPESSYSFASHARSHRITHETARTDLRKLTDHGFLVRRSSGRRHIFMPAPDLPRLLTESKP